jgi:hypothetical protein
MTPCRRRSWLLGPAGMAALPRRHHPHVTHAVGVSALYVHAPDRRSSATFALAGCPARRPASGAGCAAATQRSRWRTTPRGRRCGDARTGREPCQLPDPCLRHLGHRIGPRGPAGSLGVAVPKSVTTAAHSRSVNCVNSHPFVLHGAGPKAGKARTLRAGTWGGRPWDTEWAGGRR